jgi:hypothetical protein
MALDAWSPYWEDLGKRIGASPLAEIAIPGWDRFCQVE